MYKPHFPTLSQIDVFPIPILSALGSLINFHICQFFTYSSQYLAYFSIPKGIPLLLSNLRGMLHTRPALPFTATVTHQSLLLFVS